jgi:hypothetical protein
MCFILQYIHCSTIKLQAHAALAMLIYDLLCHTPIFAEVFSLALREDSGFISKAIYKDAELGSFISHEFILSQQKRPTVGALLLSAG